MSETFQMETFTLYKLSEPSEPFEAGGYTVRLEPRRLVGETPVCFYWLLAHPMSGYYFESEQA